MYIISREKEEEKRYDGEEKNHYYQQQKLEKLFKVMEHITQQI